MAGIGTVRTQRSRFPLLLLSFAFIFRHHGNNSSAHLPHSTSQQLNHRHSTNHANQSKLTLPRRRQYTATIRLLHGSLGGGAHRPRFWCAPFAALVRTRGCFGAHHFPMRSCHEKTSNHFSNSLYRRRYAGIQSFKNNLLVVKR